MEELTEVMLTSATKSSERTT